MRIVLGYVRVCLLPSSFGGPLGVFAVATVYLHHTRQFQLSASHKRKRRRYTYETYSLSFFVVRTSGSLPKRPMRTSLARSEERDADEEKAYDTPLSISNNNNHNKSWVWCGRADVRELMREKLLLYG